ncbi:MAG: Ig-like domain-containing protein, partial [Bacillota bacterium]
MKKIFLILLLMLLVLPAVPLFAEPNLVSLTINEELVPGPNDIYLTVTGILSNGVTQQIREGLSWSSSDTSIAEVSWSGRVHFTGKGGPVTITVFKNGVSGKKTVTVNPWPESIDIETTLVYSENPYRLLVKGRFSDGETRYFGPHDGVQWHSSNPWVAWVNSQGVVTFSGEEGYVSIKATVGKYSDSVNTTVSESEEDNKWRKGIKIKEDIKYSSTPQKLTLVAVMTDETEEEIPAGGADWSSSNSEIAVVDSEGTIKFTGKPGFTKITVSYGGYSYEKLVSVERFLEKVTINESLNYTPSWEKVPLPLTVTARYNDGSEFIQSTGLTWSTDNIKVAAVSESGVLTFTGEPGKVTVKVSGKGFDNKSIEDAVTVEVKAYEKPVPQRLFMDLNPFPSSEPLTPRAFCIYSDGSIRDVTTLANWFSSTPETASVYKGQIYITPNPGPVKVGVTYGGLSDEASGYVDLLPGNKARIYQLRIKERGLAFTYKPVKLTGLALAGDGSAKDVTGKLKWRSSQPL